jgi:hypothetical protein
MTTRQSWSQSKWPQALRRPKNPKSSYVVRRDALRTAPPPSLVPRASKTQEASSRAEFAECRGPADDSMVKDQRYAAFHLMEQPTDGI